MLYQAKIPSILWLAIYILEKSHWKNFPSKITISYKFCKRFFCFFWEILFWFRFVLLINYKQKERVKKNKY